MQGRGLVQFLSVILGLVCLYYCWNTWACSQVEKDAASYAQNKHSDAISSGINPDSVNLLVRISKNFYLDSMTKSDESIFLGQTYKQCRETKLNMGLDLQGGMSLTLQVSLIDVIKTLSNNSRSKELSLTIDGQIQEVISSKIRVLVKKSNRYAYLIKFKESDYFKTLRNKMAWKGNMRSK